MLQKIKSAFDSSTTSKELQKLSLAVDKINELEKPYESLTDTQLSQKTQEFRKRLEKEQTLDDLLVEAFAAVREASKRTIGLRHYDVQLVGGMVLHSGKIAEMKTGEGKTLVATLPLYLNALTGKGVHLVTVNDYLARRDARWMAPIYHLLGLSVGVLQMASRTENGQKAFLVDFSVQSSHEDQHGLRLVDRVDAYKAGITYGTNSEFGFDYLRDNLTMRLIDRVQHGHSYGIVDEVDNILIDEARTPLIISGPAQDEAEWYIKTAQVVRQLRSEDYEVSEKDRSVSLTELGEAHVEELLGTPLKDPERPEDITPEQARLLGYLEQALRAQFLYRRNKDYLVQSGQVIIVDEFTGRLMPGRRWSEGLHQAVEAKEGVKVQPENVTYATITLQNYFRMYSKLAGMTGTAYTEKEEFYKIYRLDIVPIPTNLEFIATRINSELALLETKDEDGYKFQYYAKRGDKDHAPVFWKRKDYPDMVYRTEEAKLRAITLEILRHHVAGRPQLVGTTSVEHSERLSDRLGAEPLRRLILATLIRQAWLQGKPDSVSEKEIPELKFLNQPLDKLNTSEMRNMAKSLGIQSMNPDDPENEKKLLVFLRLAESDGQRLTKALQGGTPHQVLNARKHDEEAVIIARAGAFGAVTIATNMAGRGVDIKLGGVLRDDILQDVIHVITRAGSDPFGKSNEELHQMVGNLTPEQIGIHEESIQAFKNYFNDMERVRRLGGLHVIGSERHEARRIDNQLRGRSARQGDPGSSRFYLSLEDELMRLFGGQRAQGLMSMFNIDPSVPIESGILGRLVEQSQERVEGYNFDVRKHLLEYDDVLNQQRKRIYAERDRVFTKNDLLQDVIEMLHAELKIRIPEGLADKEGAWKLLAYLEQIQPTMHFEPEKALVPSFTQKLILEELKKRIGENPSHDAMKKGLLEIAQAALDMEKEHLMQASRELIDRTEETFNAQHQERKELLDTFFEGVTEPDEKGQPRRAQQILDELSSLVRIPIRLQGDQLRMLAEGSGEAKRAIQEQMDSALISITMTRLVGAFERRLDESLELKPTDLTGKDWAAVADTLLKSVEFHFDRRTNRLVGSTETPNGEIVNNLDSLISRYSGKAITDQDLLLMITMISHGMRVQIDSRTHQRGWRRVILLNYFFLAARTLEKAKPEEAIEAIQKHFVDSQKILQSLYGQMEMERLTQMGATLPILEPVLKTRFEETLGQEKTRILGTTPLAQISEDEKNPIAAILGWKIQNDIYRTILLSVISELWVDYLTRVEAVRVSISLESYAQRDPLVEYKSKATDLFKTLFGDIRQGVISRMFLLQPRRTAPSSQPRMENAPMSAAGKAAEKPASKPSGTEKKKKRHRH
jgi:preprotein translocase subunit SecA